MEATRTIRWLLPMLAGMLLLVTACRAPLPRLEPYGDPPDTNWSIASDSEVAETLGRLREHPAPKVREQAERVADSIATLEENRSERIRSIERETENDRDRLGEMIMVEVDTTRLPGGTTPEALRRKMIEDAKAAEAEGEIGRALECAGIASAIDKFTPGLDAYEEQGERPRDIERRLTRRLELIRFVDPDLAVRLVTDAPDPATDSTRNGPVLEFGALRERGDTLSNATALVELMLTRHADGPSIEELHRSGVEEVVAFCEILDQHGHPDAGVLLEAIRSSGTDPASDRTMKLLSSLDRMQLEHAAESLPRYALARVFVEGAAGALDHRTRLIWPDEFARYLRHVGREYRGMGTTVEQRADGSVVLDPIAGGPAAQAGIRTGDRLLEINGRSIESISLEDMTLIATDPDKESIELTVERSDDGTTESLMIRLGPVQRPHVSGWMQSGLDQAGMPLWNWLADPEQRIAYIQLDGFRSDGDRAIRIALQEAQRQSEVAGGRLEGLILDLRMNGGGQVDIAEEVANLFMEDGTIFRSTDGKRQIDDERARRSHSELSGIPLVILVDERSASASELVSGLLQARGEAVVVGDRTFGKGSIQAPMRAFTGDCMALVTTGWYLLPHRGAEDDEPWRYVDRDKSADAWGVRPDVTVPMSFDETTAALNHRTRWYSGLGRDVMPEDHEEIIGPPDPALETALALLQARVVSDPKPVPRRVSPDTR
jgi:carboxyl-terminal processing protease